MKTQVTQIITVDVGKERINFEKLLLAKTKVMDKRFFETYGFHWYLSFAKWGIFLSRGQAYKEPLIGRQSFDKVPLFLNRDRRETFEVVHVAIGKFVPKVLRDAVLYHELREIFWLRAGTPPDCTAHQMARKDEADYVARFLSEQEKQLWQRFVDRVSVDKDNRAIWQARPARPRDGRIADAIFI